MNKTEKIQIVLTKEDSENIKKAAKLEGLNFSTYARRVVVMHSNKIMKEYYKENKLENSCLGFL